MKKIILLFLGLAFASFAFGQKLNKEEMEAKIDTLTKENAALIAKNNDLGAQLAPLMAIYDSLKMNYFKTEFTAKDVTPKMEGLLHSDDGAVDSLTTENTKLKTKIEELTTGAAALQKEKEQVIRDLESAKKLLDQGILTEEEFQTIKKKYISKL